MADDQYIRYRIEDAADIISAMLLLIHTDEGFQKFVEDEAVGRLLHEKFQVFTPEEVQKDFQELRTHGGKGITILLDCMNRLGERYGLIEGTPPSA